MKNILILLSLLFIPSIALCQLPFSGGKPYYICGGSSSITPYNISTVYLSTATHRCSIFINPLVSFSTTTLFTTYQSTTSTIIIYDSAFQAVPANNIQNAGQVNFSMTFEPKLVSLSLLTNIAFPKQVAGSWMKMNTCGGTSYCYQGGWPSVYLPLGVNEVVLAFDLTYSSNSTLCSWTTNNNSIIIFDQYTNVPAVNNLQTLADMETMFNFQPVAIDTNTFTKPQ
jgi:hypothetical protein